MRKYIFMTVVVALMLVGCGNDSEDKSVEASAERKEEQEQFLAEEIREDLYKDTFQMKDLLTSAFRSENKLTIDEEVLLDRYDATYDVSDLNLYESDVTFFIFELHMIHRQNLRGDPLLDSEPSYRTQFEQKLKELDNLLDTLEVIKE